MENIENLMFFRGTLNMIRPLAFQLPATLRYVVSLRAVAGSVMVDETMSLVKYPALTNAFNELAFSGFDN